MLLTTLCWNSVSLCLHDSPRHVTVYVSAYSSLAVFVTCSLSQPLTCGAPDDTLPALFLFSHYMLMAVNAMCMLISPRAMGLLSRALSWAPDSGTCWVSHFACCVDTSNPTVLLIPYLRGWGHRSLSIPPATQARRWWLPSTFLLLEIATHWILLTLSLK